MRIRLAVLWIALPAGLACGGGDATPAAGPVNLAPWPMHPIDSRFRGANSLGPGDVDGDGQRDYVTNYEFDQRYVVSLHPPAGQDPRLPWPTVVAFQPGSASAEAGVNPEHSALGDLDGDGNLDVIAAQGDSDRAWWEGNQPGIRVIWGPPRDRVLDPAAWTDAGRIPATIDRGHFLFVMAHDVNGDGARDVIAGGRLQATGRWAGLVWIEAPRDAAARRDLQAWVVHDIDPGQTGAHGFVLDDVDRDGDPDIVLANADFDTPGDQEAVLWYENPGTGSADQALAWARHEIYRGSEFHGKPQVVPADLDADGLVDLVVQVPDAFYWFRKTSTAPVAFERVAIPKDPAARWPGRTTRVADVDGDGRLDLVGMAVHADGTLPPTAPAAFWMSRDGVDPAGREWSTHVIKWGSGKTMVIPEFGEKWDQADLVDVDGDGDLDLVANCEEWWQDGGMPLPFWEPGVGPASVAVVWFENRVREPVPRCVEAAGLCVQEAERHADLLDGTWIEQSRWPGFAGHGYVEDHEVLDASARDFGASLGISWVADLDGGTYRLWLRRWVPSQWGQGLGGALSDSCWASIDGSAPAAPVDDGAVETDAWGWVAAGDPVALPAGRHEVRLRVREGGFAVDRLLLSSDPGFVPAGLGPDATPGGSAALP